ncbi:ATP-binding protein [Thalassospira tepidiphila]|jgi:predicted kinase|uniref:AAA family ATPase n=1 Tax=Thalassospira tepidiphila TaxID=393657 RepID=UPI001BCCD097|nr:ATP-binding protein [Thalassospira tepidiphila]MBS8272163.1 ATP-binding protein [Thalassospira tepidiphila]
MTRPLSELPHTNSPSTPAHGTRAGTLHMLCGKIAAGKSTLAAELARKPGTVLIAEDEWLSTLFGDQMRSVADYVRVSEKLRGVMGPHVAMLLRCGVSVVLDFPANTVGLRNWMRGIVEEAGAEHVLHYLDLEDDVCIARLRVRNRAGTHQFAASDAQFHQINAAFVPPSVDEGFNVVTHQTETL